MMLTVLEVLVMQMVRMMMVMLTAMEVFVMQMVRVVW